MATTYAAPITLGFTPTNGDLIGGTVNGVEVSGKWNSGGGVILFEGALDVSTYDSGGGQYVCSVGIIDGQALINMESESAPTTDYELHLYRYTPADIVQIPQEYVEGLEATAADATEAKTTAETAQSTANSAKTTAETAQSTANSAKTTAETAQSTANSAKTTAETAQSTANSANTTAKNAQSTANSAKTTAETAQSTANSAKTTAESAVKPDYGYLYRFRSTSAANPYTSIYIDDYAQSRTTQIFQSEDTALTLLMTRDGGGSDASTVNNPATIKLLNNSGLSGNVVVDGVKAFIVPSSTAGSTKKFKITVSDDARPTFTDTSDPTDTWTPGENLPTVTSSDSGKFLRVSESGAWEAEETAIPSQPIIVDAEANMSTGSITISSEDSIQKMNAIDTAYKAGKPCSAYLRYLVNNSYMWCALIAAIGSSDLYNFLFATSSPKNQIRVAPSTNGDWMVSIDGPTEN